MAESLTQDELEFARAMEKFKKAGSKPFPSWSEVLKVLKELGYRRSEQVRRKKSDKTVEPQV